MVVLKCKMCGGDLHPEENATTCECEFCGTLQTIPSVDDEKKLTLFGRAQRLLFACEFDKASAVYESIVADFPTEAEAYWGLVLCKYGIEYVDDPGTKKKIPTCHRTSFDSVMDDSNYEQALENTDPVAKRVYREEAKTIEELRKKIIEVSSKEEPYDIFISYKETDENGNRTLDSVLAQDIYSELTGKGYKVFFSRITLEDKLGQEYEPYIFAALNSAKIMLVVGSDYEYFNSVWVKNEWGRFLKLIASGEKKTLIPCYKNIDAYDMPKEFSKLQAQDMGKVGAMQDLIRGIEKILDSSSSSQSREEKEREDAKKQQVANYLKMAENALRASNEAEAETYSNKVMELDSENYQAWIIKGKAAGWQSSLQNNRMPETITAFINAVTYAPEEKKEDIGKETTAELNKLFLAMYQTYMNKIAQWPDADTAQEVASTIDSMKMCTVLFNQKTGYTMDIEELARAVAQKSHEAFTAATPAIYRAYRAKKYPDKNEWTAFITKLTSISMVVGAACDFLGDDDDYAAKLYDDLANAHNDMANSAGYLSSYFNFQADTLPQYAVQHVCLAYREKGYIPEPSENMVYAKLIELPAESKENSRKLAIEYKNKAAQIRQRKQAEQERQAKEAAKKRFDAYWQTHDEQKAALLKEKENLNSQITELTREHNFKSSELNQKLRSATDDKEIKDLESQISQMSSSQASLGIFKGKEKKALQEQIDQVRSKKRTLSDNMASAKKSIQNEIDSETQEYERKTKPLRSRISEIENELTKPR